MIVGGSHEDIPFYSTDPVTNIEFFPPKDNGVPRSLAFLERSLPVNLFPRFGVAIRYLFHSADIIVFQSVLPT